MAFTMHSHSGQFCPGHAKDDLEEIVEYAIMAGYKTMGLTEHMPRFDLSDLYPEELKPDPQASLAALQPRHEAFLVEAQRLQEKYASQLHILIGFEGEWIRPAYGDAIAGLAAHPAVDYFVGSVHHGPGGIPIDFDRRMYDEAVAAAGGDEESLYARYFDAQFEMLQAVRPRVVGHFDLVKLMSADPGRKLKGWGSGQVWEKVVRNLEEVKSYGGWLELNTSALRKGLPEPYPSKEISEEWLRLGGKFTFSDDSHGIAQLATNYQRGLNFLLSLGVEEVWTLERSPHPGTEGSGKAELKEKAVPIEEFRKSLVIRVN